MRITSGMITRNTQNYIQDGMQRMARTQEMMSTSKKIIRLSDDPTAISQLLDVRSNVEMNKQYMRNIQDGLSYLYGADTALDTAGNIVKKAKEYALQAANGTLNDNDRKAIAEQIDKMIDELIDVANTTVGGKYIFAGTDNFRQTFKRDETDPTKIYYYGDMNRVSREILDQASYPIDVLGVTLAQVDLGNPLDGGTGIGKDEIAAASDGKLIINGIEVAFSASDSYTAIAENINNNPQLEGVYATFINNGAGVQNSFIISCAGASLSVAEKTGNTFGATSDFATNGESDQTEAGVFGFYDASDGSVTGGVFDTLLDLAQWLRDDNLEERDGGGNLIGGLQYSLEQLETQHDHLLRYRVQVGARTNHFESVRDQLQDQELRLTQVISNLEDADIARVSVDLAQQQLVYQSSLSAAAQILQISLLNFLK